MSLRSSFSNPDQTPQEPPQHFYITRDILVEDRTHGPVPVLPCCIPDLHLNDLSPHIDLLHRELHPHRNILSQDELVADVPGEDVGFPDTTVPWINHCLPTITTFRSWESLGEAVMTAN